MALKPFPGFGISHSGTSPPHTQASSREKRIEERVGQSRQLPDLRLALCVYARLQTKGHPWHMGTTWLSLSLYSQQQQQQQQLQQQLQQQQSWAPPRDDKRWVNAALFRPRAMRELGREIHMSPLQEVASSHSGAMVPRFNRTAYFSFLEVRGRVLGIAARNLMAVQCVLFRGQRKHLRH
ncbi:uncharacterized protein PADG_02250 [Paracoccidioides brasiliensis Pb18]|uniref:Uncharacterized protein n=1 Tax=Paracoccidioides brasiliensis (strain Pb18) TaxID=502780 RepID=C1G284_PARBD|nr:uncharacterized protein PADG_02250 [Paracoccidioides brasiliensis Pb18]EEH46100.2 hypothetical protein PADG_02250 [Paracoccidioides brasiliensis Pb18]